MLKTTPVSSRLCITTLTAEMFSTTLPRPRAVLKYSPQVVPSHTQLLIATLCTPPAVSLPIPTPHPPALNVQFVTTIFSEGRNGFPGICLYPDFTMTQSSPLLM